MRRKTSLLILVITFIFTLIPIKANAVNTLSGMTINNISVKLSSQPVVKNGRTMVPIRDIFDSLGLSLDWDPYAKEIVARRYDKELVFYLDNKLAFVNRDPILLHTPPTIYKGKTYVPVKELIESLNGKVALNAISNRLEITLPLSTNERSKILQIEQQKYNEEKLDLLERQRIANLKYQANYLRSLKTKTKYKTLDSRIYNTIIEMKVMKLNIDPRSNINNNIKALMYSKNDEILLNTDQRAFQLITTSFLLDEITVDKGIELLTDLYEQRKSVE